MTTEQITDQLNDRNLDFVTIGKDGFIRAKKRTTEPDGSTLYMCFEATNGTLLYVDGQYLF